MDQRTSRRADASPRAALRARACSPEQPRQLPAQNETLLPGCQGSCSAVFSFQTALAAPLFNLAAPRFHFLPCSLNQSESARRPRRADERADIISRQRRIFRTQTVVTRGAAPGLDTGNKTKVLKLETSHVCSPTDTLSSAAAAGVFSRSQCNWLSSTTEATNKLSK